MKKKIRIEVEFNKREFQSAVSKYGEKKVRDMLQGELNILAGQININETVQYLDKNPWELSDALTGPS